MENLRKPLLVLLTFIAILVQGTELREVSAESGIVRQFEFGIGPMDLWGQLCGPPPTGNTCEDNRLLVESTMEKAEQINSTVLLITDFYVLADFDMNLVIQEGELGSTTLTQDELSDIVSRAREHGQNNTILITNIFSHSPEIRNHLESNFVWNTDNPDLNIVKTIFKNWENAIVLQAQKAEVANFDSIVVNPRDIGLFFDVAENRFAWQGIIDSVHQNFSGDVCMWGDTFTLTAMDKLLTGIGCYILDETIHNFFGDVNTEDVTAIKNTWKKFLTEGIWTLNDVSNLFSKADTYILLFMPSYDGAIQNGWIEPVTIYPEGQFTKDFAEQATFYEGFFQAVHELTSLEAKGMISYGYWWSDKIHPEIWPRSDLSHSIRNKDAEDVFARWSHRFRIETLPDADGDGVFDSDDFCPDFPGKPETNGC